MTTTEIIMDLALRTNSRKDVHKTYNLFVDGGIKLTNKFTGNELNNEEHTYRSYSTVCRILHNYDARNVYARRKPKIYKRKEYSNLVKQSLNK